ncbi:PREDICTED: DEAD-box ATP-dependent RNA helicase 42-like [Cyphomyrmex costatus]|uniref:DEAD-box ATP-dependent RNA helicase 42-like n=1 Tax=Cyphomyrmex costatus TaxID=456900 RepID=UPI0008522868|nr:PREDICTED: DEAD-box ATP-dependent RNA helicase 42-like [Cyphomyrmex costatus]
MGESQERSRIEIIKKIEDSNRDLEKKVMTELKKEMEKMGEENMKVIEELKKENVELKREVTELKRREEERERKKNIIIKGEQVEGGSARQVAENLCNEICGEEVRVEDAIFCGSCEVSINGEQAEEKDEGEGGERGRERRGEDEKDRDSKIEKKEEILRDRCSNNSSKGERKGVNECGEVWENFWEFLGNFEIIGLLETWIDEKEWGKLKEKMPKEWRWKCQPADRDKRRGRAKGGIITGIRKEIEENKEELESREGIQERKIILNGEKWRVVTIYNREGRKKGLEDLQEVIKEEEKRKMVMVGDFNARIGKEGGVRTLSGEEKRPEEGKRVSKDKVINKQGKELLRVIEER